jgi:hypothetical protein
VEHFSTILPLQVEYFRGIKTRAIRSMRRKAEELKEDTIAKIYQMKVQFERKANTRLSALTFLVK